MVLDRDDDDESGGTLAQAQNGRLKMSMQWALIASLETHSN